MTFQNRIIDINGYEKIEKIGNGGYGTVYKARNKTNGAIHAVKISEIELTEENQDSEEAHSIFIEINIASLMNHPAIIKFNGYSHIDFEGERRPTIVMEYAPNGSLRNIISANKTKPNIKNWNPTKKLIMIYGIASSILYLHKYDIIHRDLKPENILIDRLWQPKISDFGLSKILKTPMKSLLLPSGHFVKGTLNYMAPEILEYGNYTKSGDIYAFSLIVYEIITGETPFYGLNFFQITKKVVSNGERPKLTDKIPNAYKKLIEKCWDQDYEKRPTIQKVICYLKNNKEFLDDSIDKKEFFNYVEYIDNYKADFNESQQLIHYIDFIRTKKITDDEPLPIIKPKIPIVRPKNKEKRPDLVSLKHPNNKPSINDDISKTAIEIPYKKPKLPPIKKKINVQQPLKKENSNPRNNVNNLYPSSEFQKLDQQCKSLVIQANQDPKKQFIVGKLLIEGDQNFPHNIELGLKFIEKANQKNCLESKLYYVEMLIKGKVITQDIKKAKELLDEIGDIENSDVFALRGKIERKNKNYREALYYYEKGVFVQNKECTYNYAKMHFLGEGTNRRRDISQHYFSQIYNYKKTANYLKALDFIYNDENYEKLQPETQEFLISNVIQNNTNFIRINSEQIEFLHKNQSLKLNPFINCLKKFEKISIEIEYPLNSFVEITNRIFNIKSFKIRNLVIGVIFVSFTSPIPKNCFSNQVSYATIDSSLKVIPCQAFRYCKYIKQFSIPSFIISINEYAFSECSSLKQISIPSSVTKIEKYAFSGCSSLTEITIPSSVTEIGEYAFYECKSLKRFSIPPSVQNVGQGVFNKCKSLLKIDFIHPSSINLIPFGFCNQCTKLSEINIPPSVTEIGACAFQNCDSLEIVTTSCSLKKIGNCAFDYCKSLKPICVPPDCEIDTGLFNQYNIY